ncbi:MAG: OmpA family protein [Elusimicrobia bacterium]|nr:OmpA family protein [Elusimicrobiota bacterium]
MPLAALAASGCVSSATYRRSVSDAGAFQAKAEGLQAQLASRSAELAAAQGELASAKDALRKARGDLDASAKALDAARAAREAAASSWAQSEAELNGKLAAAEEKLRSAEQQVASLKGSVRDLKESLDASQGELSRRLAALVVEKDQTAQKLAEAQSAAAKLRQAKDSELAEAQAAAAKARQTQEAELAEVARSLESATREKASLASRLEHAEAARLQAEKAREEEVAKLRQGYEDLASTLKSEISAGEVKLTQLQGRLTVQLVDRILFDSGSAEIKPAGRKILARIGTLLNELADKDLRIEGHTDNVPISAELRSKYPSNWELSTARATSVARYLQDEAKVEPLRLIAAGYGEHRPVAANDKPETRAQNRRIEIVLIARER